tara:strand:+ start:4438 stop:4677 length:240 start_codon:yes stop_codon:yes gene_type:complete
MGGLAESFFLLPVATIQKLITTSEAVPDVQKNIVENLHDGIFVREKGKPERAKLETIRKLSTPGRVKSEDINPSRETTM